MIVLEPGPGMGFFTLELARLVGPEGRVVAVDVQPKMIAGLRRRAERAGLLDRIDVRVAPESTMALEAWEGVEIFFSWPLRSSMKCLRLRRSSPKPRAR
ncbi:methyltransferase domain-containing protein [Roseiarcus sp.]|uniref:methyltransferase domain-containing protein n=1 Tax=Roseiarcus sp. TaxID=1969460 RepID=UPI003F9C9D39